MNCCGNKRNAWQQNEQPQDRKTPDGASSARAVKTINFKYIGPTALTVVGQITAQHYRFAAPGTVIAVDARDAASMMAVPHLKRARSQT